MSETKLDLEKLRELEAKATPGPWKTHALHHRDGSNVRPSTVCVEHDEDAPRGYNPCAEIEAGSADTADLIAAMRNALPALLAAAEALARIAKLNCGYGDPGECADALRGDTSSVDRPCAACIAREALAGKAAS